MKKNNHGFAILELIIITAIIVGVGVIGAWALNSSNAASGSPAKNKLFLLGGSQLARTSNNNYHINNEFDANGWLTSHDAEGGRSFQEALKLLQTTRKKAATNSRVMVIILGLNNDHNTKKEFIKHLDDMHQYIKNVNKNDVTVYMVNYAAFHRNSKDMYRVNKIPTLNSWLAEYAEANGIRIINWNSLATKNNKTFYNNQDGTHPNKTGQRALLNLIKNRVGAFNSFK